MAREPEAPAALKRTVFWRAFGKCEYGSCGNNAAVIDETGVLRSLGSFSHILPLGYAGPRAEYRANFPDVELNSPENMLLLCGDHHTLVDVTEVREHPPALLFSMVQRRATAFTSHVDQFAWGYDFDLQSVSDDLNLGRIVSLVNQATLEGPLKAVSILREASSLLDELERNPFLSLPSGLLPLLRLEIVSLRLSGTYNRQVWAAAPKQVCSCIASLTRPRHVAAAVQTAGIIVRDEYGVLDTQERLGFIKQFIQALEVAIKEDDEPSFRSFSLSVKAGLLRWRGRIMRGAQQTSAFSESERCARLSIKTQRSLAGNLQLALALYTHARSLSIRESDLFCRLMLEADSLLLSADMEELSAATRYRPRYLRETYRFSESIDAFWLAVELGHRPEMLRTAFVLAEASFSEYVYERPTSSAHVQDALEFCAEALEKGYNHGRNVAAWIECKAILDPRWFDAEILAMFSSNSNSENLLEILDQVDRRFLRTDTKKHDLLFGVDELDFWVMLGRVSRHLTGNVDKAIMFYEQAERYSSIKNGNFSSRLGLASALSEKGDVQGARRYFFLLRDNARAFQARIVEDLQSKLRSMGVLSAGASGLGSS